MGTVLNGHSLQEMKTFYKLTGSHSHCMWDNLKATGLWIEKLSGESTYDTQNDLQPLELVRWMTMVDREDRPTADQVIKMISEWAGNISYFGMCCEVSEVTEIRNHATTWVSLEYSKGDGTKILEASMTPQEPLDWRKLPKQNGELDSVPSASQSVSGTFPLQPGDEQMPKANPEGVKKGPVTESTEHRQSGTLGEGEGESDHGNDSSTTLTPKKIPCLRSAGQTTENLPPNFALVPHR